MTKRNRRIFLLMSLAFLCGISAGQQQNSKSGKYFSLLQERPEDGYLYDRFYNEWLETGTIEQLVSFLKANLDKNDNAANRLLLAFLYERQGRDAEALELYRNIPGSDSVTAEYLFYKAKAEARNLKFETAIADLVRARKVPGLDETAEKAGKLLGKLYIRTNQKDKAAELWSQLLETGKDIEELYEDLIELQINEGLFDDALRTSDQLISITKDKYKAVMRSLRKGDIYLYKAESQRALDVYAETLKMVGEGSWLENQICSQIEEVFNRDDNTDGLKECLENLVKTHPRRMGLKKRLARLLVDTDQADQALEMFQEILRVTPGDKANQKAYVETLAQAGRLDKAITLLEQLFEYNNQDREILISLADLYHRNKQDDKVGPILNRFLDLSDRTEYAYLRVGGILERYKLKEQAQTVYEQMIDELPGSLSSLQVYAEFLHRDNRKDEALGIFETIAGRGDLQMLIQASNAAGTRGRYDLALKWVEARYSEFSNDVTYLNHLCKIAIRLEEFDRALIWARHQLEMATTFSMIRSAISQVIGAVNSDEKARGLIRELEAMGKMTIQQACLLSELLESQNSPAKANAVLARAALIDPKIASRQQIHIYRLRRDWASAAEHLESLIARSGSREPSLIRELIELYQKSRRYEDGLKWVLTWEEISPASAEARLYHSQLLSSLGRKKDAIDILDAADREFRGNTEVLLRLAKLYTADGKHDDAQRVYWRLYEKADSASAKLGFVRSMSKAAEQTGNRQELIRKLKNQHQRNRSSPVPLLALAEVYKLMGKYEERRQALLEATRIQTNDVNLIYELAAAEEEQGDWKKAAETLKRAIALDKTSKTRLRIADLYIKNGSRDDGFRILTEVAGGEKMDPRDAEAIAGTMMASGGWLTAANFLQGMLPLHPKDYKLHYQYAVALEESGRKAEAMEAFIDLLGFRDEIPGNAGKNIRLSWKRQGMDTNIEQILPAEAVELLRFSQYRSAAYGYRESPGRYVRGPMSAAASRTLNSPTRTKAKLQSPPTVEDLRGFAVSHILALSGDLSSARQAQVRADLRRHSILRPDAMIEISKFGLIGLDRPIENLAPRYPTDKAIQAVWILRRIEGRGCTLEEAKRIFDLFVDSNPRLAAIVGLGCYGTDKIASELFARSLRILQDIPDPGYYEGMVISHVLQNEDSRYKLTAAQRELLDRHLVDWYWRLPGGSYFRGQTFRHVAALLAKRDDLTEYVRFLDNELSHCQKSGSVAGHAPSTSLLIMPLNCPPRNLPGVPGHLLRMVRSGPGDLLVGRRAHAARIKWHMEYGKKIADYTAAAQNLTLKVLMAMESRRWQEAERMTADLIEKEPTSPGAYILAASLATRRNEADKAVRLLDRARSLPLSPQYASLIDGAIVAGATDLDLQRFPNEIEIARKAVVRMMGKRLDARQSEELIGTAEKLGLPEQADSLKNRIFAQLAGAGPGTHSRGQRTSVRTIRKFFEDGNTDSALRLSLGYLKDIGKDSPHPLSWRYSGRTKELVDLLRTQGAVDKLLELARPPEKASAVRVAEYGRICELLGLGERAHAAYEEAITQDPKNTVARTELAIFLAKTDPDTSARHLAAADSAPTNQAGSKIVTCVEDLYRHGRLDDALDMVVVAVKYLDLLQDSSSANLNWIDDLADAITRRCEHPDCPLYCLYEVHSRPTNTHLAPGGGTYVIQSNTFVMGGVNRGTATRHFVIPNNPRRSSSPENATAARKRRKAHNQLCRKMLEVPQLAEAGFSRLAAEAKVRRAFTDELTETARRTMLTCVPSRYPLKSRATSTTGYSPASQTARLICPAEYLVLGAHTSKTLDNLVDRFIPELKRNNKHDQAQKLKLFADVYTAPSGNFFVAVDSLLGSILRTKVGIQYTADDEAAAFQFAIGAHLSRRLNTDQDMSNYVLSKIKEDLATGNSEHHRLAEYWLLSLVSSDRRAAKVFFDSAMALYNNPSFQSGLAHYFISSYSWLFDANRGNKTVRTPGSRSPRTTSEQNRPNRGTGRRMRNSRSRNSRSRDRGNQ